MDASIKKRLTEVEAKLGYGDCPVVFMPLKGETDAECRARMERWKAGEDVEGIDHPYTGQNLAIILVKFGGSDQSSQVDPSR